MQLLKDVGQFFYSTDYSGHFLMHLFRHFNVNIYFGFPRVSIAFGYPCLSFHFSCKFFYYMVRDTISLQLKLGSEDSCSREKNLEWEENEITKKQKNNKKQKKLAADETYNMEGFNDQILYKRNAGFLRESNQTFSIPYKLIFIKIYIHIVRYLKDYSVGSSVYCRYFFKFFLVEIVTPICLRENHSNFKFVSSLKTVIHSNNCYEFFFYSRDTSINHNIHSI